MQQAVRNYNDRYHSTIKRRPNDVQSHSINFDEVRANLKKTKEKWINKTNEKREEYNEKRTTGFLKNYKAARLKHQPRFVKGKLQNVHPSNIKRPLKFNILPIEKDYPDNRTELPDLTEEQLSIINTAINEGPDDEVLTSKFRMDITRRDIKSLKNNKWLNDKIIEFYLKLIVERSKESNFPNSPKVFAMNTFFATRLLNVGYQSIKRWTRSVNIFDYDILLIPVHVNQNHWAISIIDFPNKTMKYYDSLGVPNAQILETLEEYLRNESMDKPQIPFDTSNFIKDAAANTPQQENANDCGVFSCSIAENISKHRQILFTQENIPYIRKRMIVEIIQGKLLT
ncbi:sentrin-specific protease 1-like [Hermetia illucens]|uniref:sentrin-specific protease 1-like n=1 Tax=Hermetia illucens TaxID=343691 RepID=UPI0018CBFD1F|nr:sentrin-specific protease 1-like [Hermetia illucens]